MGLSTLRVLSVCTGAGGLDRGVHLALPNACVVCCVEHEAYAVESLASQMEAGYLDAAPIWTDLRTFDGRPWRAVVDCIVGGYPCQPFSVAGKRGGESDSRHLWPSIARIIGETEPALCFFENVPGHLTLGFDTVCRELQEMGYRVAAGLFSAEETGAPHKRERLFIMAKHDRRFESRQCADGGWSDVIGSGRELAHPEGSNRRSGDPRITGEQRERGRGLRGGCSELADSRNGQLQEPWRGEERRTGISPTGSELEHSEGGRRAAGNSGGRWQERAPVGNGDLRLPLFPPSPTDFESWGRVLEIDSSLKPAICRMANGMADRADRLRLCGNGAVPLAVGYAFLSLWTCLWSAPVIEGVQP